MLEDLDDPLRHHGLRTFDDEGAAVLKSLKAVRAGKTSALGHQVGIYRRLDEALRSPASK